MPKWSRPPLVLADLQADGPPVRLRDLVAITGLSNDTLYRDIQAGYLHAFKRRGGRSASYFVDRDVARHWLTRMGFRVERTSPTASVVVLAERRAATGRI